MALPMILGTASSILSLNSWKSFYRMAGIASRALIATVLFFTFLLHLTVNIINSFIVNVKLFFYNINMH